MDFRRDKCQLNVTRWKDYWAAVNDKTSRWTTMILLLMYLFSARPIYWNTKPLFLSLLLSSWFAYFFLNPQLWSWNSSFATQIVHIFFDCSNRIGRKGHCTGQDQNSERSRSNSGGVACKDRCRHARLLQAEGAGGLEIISIDPKKGCDLDKT